MEDRAQEFRDKLSNLLSEYADTVGPGLDDEPPVEMPMAIAWVIVTDWDDLGDGSESSTTATDSGVRRSQRAGMLAVATEMALGDP